MAVLLSLVRDAIEDRTAVGDWMSGRSRVIVMAVTRRGAGSRQMRPAVRMLYGRHPGRVTDRAGERSGVRELRWKVPLMR
ncbi:hypothetical protein [Edaphobacter aggregans]|uniref:hypothetical protein n=1 Tax=Edaphobacter aggregans TaxID=570835 RepID=UPI00054EF78D|nr:hypothetical protein [Edaphobacter aggregans]